jgi:hypothetical protein
MGIYGTGYCFREAVCLHFPNLAAIALALIAPTIGVGYCRWDHRHLVLAGLTFLAGFLVLAVLGGAFLARIRNRVRWRAQELRIVAALPPNSRTNEVSLEETGSLLLK